MFLMYRRKQACLGSRPSGKACTGPMKGLSKTPSGVTLRAGWTWSTSWTRAYVVPLQAAQW